ncbi:MAG: glycosyltransferase family 4 protein [Chthoniobacterales bacterium]|nr:glycosyltransferase family 4 protein [Chthoniobacterales bacterium]
MSRSWHVHLTGWLKIPWALDEDLRQVQMALGDRVRWSSLPRARIVQAAWPSAVADSSPGAFRGKMVICQADNPPSFYLGTEEFVRAAGRVDLWIARSREALEQFRLLDLPAVLAPYTVDTAVFRPLPDPAGIRRQLGIGHGAFVIGNFHRDSEGADVRKPKLQKGPDVFLEIARKLQEQVPELTVLLAGPRRHWLLGALRKEDIPVVHVGGEPGDADDYGRNILPRERLNELYQAMDCCVVSSRWEGGPHTVLEALAAGRPLVSSRVGMARDVLPEACLFRSPDEAVGLLASHASTGCLGKPCEEAAERAASTHNLGALRDALSAAYANCRQGAASIGESARSACAMVAGRVGLGNMPKNPGIENLRRRVCERAAKTSGPRGLIEFPAGGDMEQLMDCAAVIAAARRS